jgi:hypothetical protein
MKTIRILTSLALAACATALLHAEVPQLINHQGRIAVDGANFNGNGQFKFALVDGGTNISVQATATATVTSGFVTSISVTNGGSGYTSAPSVEISGGGGSGALATASLSGGAVSGITVNNAGSGYTSIPDVLVAAPPATYTHITYWSNDGTSTAGSEPTSAVSLPVGKGLYSVLLGDTSLTHMTAVPETVFNNTDVRLRVWFNDGATGSQLLSPDQRLGSVGYAMVAENVPDGAITAAKIATGAVGDSQVGMLSQSKIINLTADLASKAMASHMHAAGDVTTGTLSDARLSSNVALRNVTNTFSTNQTINGSLSASTIDTGQGANELHAMNQNVLTSSSPIFSGMTVNGSLSANTLNTGHGINELYAMNQDVMTTSTPSFLGLTSTGLVTVQADLKVLESIGNTYYGTLDVGDLGANATYTFNGPSGTVMTTANDGPGSTFDADLLDGFSSSAFAATTHTHDAVNIVSGLLSDARLSSNVALLNLANTFNGNMRVNNRIGIGRSASVNALEVAGDASKDVAGSWLANSDSRIKQDIRTIHGALETLDKVRLVDFRYADEYRSAHPDIEDRRYLNVVAQEFAEVFPDHVKPSGETLADGSAVLQVDTYPLTIYSAAAVQELHAATKALQKENAELMARLESIEALLMQAPAENLADKQFTPKTP